MAGRIGISDIAPLVACGAYPAKAVIGELITISATVFREGHDAVAANVVWKGPDPVVEKGAVKSRARARAGGPILRMKPASGVDRYSAQVVPDRQGIWTATVEAWSDPLETWKHAVEVKAAAGQTGAELANDLATGTELLDRIARRPQQKYAAAIRTAILALRDENRSVAERIGPALAPELWTVLTADPIRELVTKSAPIKFWIDRRLAEFGSWYELFPRSLGAQVEPDGTVLRHGTFADAVAEVPRVARMGFDILYLPPIHPIGKLNRKGRNNTVDSGPNDVGSPWAIGSAEGGHDAINPDLGTFDDFALLVATAKEHNIEIALDFALQCAPDHPWVTTHPEWFTTLADGTIAYAENPPKKYQDIYPLNFDIAPATLYAEVLRVVRFWIEKGVTVFRVDNPHTKPINFWEWLINQVHLTHPEVIFLAEAFTKPSMMHELGRLGFTQSYTYFTWRTAKSDIIDYGVELVLASDYMRPNFFVNTPDILPFHLQTDNRSMFAIRAVLASTLAATWGVYAGFELFEGEVLAPGREEYLNSEKFELRPRDFESAMALGNSLEPFITQLNTIRRTHPALQKLKGLWFHGIDNDNLLCFSKRDERSGDTILIIVALSAEGMHWGTTDLYLPALGLEWGATFDVVDELSGEAYHWGQFNPVGLDASWRVAHILSVKPR